MMCDLINYVDLPDGFEFKTGFAPTVSLISLKLFRRLHMLPNPSLTLFVLLLILKDNAFANQSDLDLLFGGDKEGSFDLLLYHLSSDYATFGCGNLLEMMNGKDTRTICVDNVPVYQKGKGNPRTTDLPKFSMNDTFDICNGGTVYAIDDVLVPYLATTTATTKPSLSDFV
jgi:hypothetical protein